MDFYSICSKRSRLEFLLLEIILIALTTENYVSDLQFEVHAHMRSEISFG